MKQNHSLLILTVLVALSLLISAGCQNEQKEMEALQKSINEFNQAWNNLELIKAFEFYDEDAIYLVPNQDVLNWEDIKQLYVNMATRSDSLRRIKSEHERNTIEIQIEGDMAYEIVSQIVRTHGEGIEPQSRKTKYLHIWKKHKGGVWKLHVDAYSSSEPLP